MSSVLSRVGSRRVILVVCGAVLTLCVAGWVAGGPAATRIVPHLGLFGAAFVAYLGALAASRGLSTC